MSMLMLGNLRSRNHMRCYCNESHTIIVCRARRMLFYSDEKLGKTSRSASNVRGMGFSSMIKAEAWRRCK